MRVDRTSDAMQGSALSHTIKCAESAHLPLSDSLRESIGSAVQAWATAFTSAVRASRLHALKSLQFLVEVRASKL